MTPTDAPNPSDRPLAGTKPPQDLAAEPIGNARRVPGTGTTPTRRAFHHGCSRRRALRFGTRSTAPAHHHRRHSIPIARPNVPRFSPIRF
jgi:hypothetical protein